MISINEEKFHKHINILQAFKVIPKTVNCSLPTMSKSTNTIGFTSVELQWQCHLVYEICAHATELSTLGLNHNHKVKGPVRMVDAPVLPTSSVVEDPRHKSPYAA